MALEIGRVCMKVAGREAGRYCVVLKKLDDAFVMVTGPRELTGVKRRRCNIDHLEPTSYLVKIEQDAAEKDIIDAYNKIGLTKKFELKLPSPEILKEAEKKAKAPVKVEVPKEEKKVEKEVKKEEKIEKKEEVKPETKPEKKEEKKGISLKIKLPSIRKGKKEEKPENKEEPKKEKNKAEKKPEKKK